MTKLDQKFVAAIKDKREREGLSIRALAAKIGMSFSSLARIERGEGAPDNNSKIRLLEWLGADADDAGLGFEDVAFVHFRAAKNAGSKTVQALLDAALCFKAAHGNSERPIEAPETEHVAVSMSKEDLEQAAERFRSDVELGPTDPLDPFDLIVDSVALETVTHTDCIDAKAKRFLMNAACREWSAMSVPLDPAQEEWIVFLNDCHTIERQRVTLLEEYWHILSGHKLTKIAKVSGAFGRTYDTAEEHDAYYMASATLLPRNAITQRVEKGQTSVQIAKAFGTSPELVEYRIKRLGLWRQHVGKKVSLSKE
ncbi:helix-turn-helix domain-containing protein [Pontixanthobacter luteolus]|nr:XRE family transcriptional regulator [Pontixanthobacter luteolus]